MFHSHKMPSFICCLLMYLMHDIIPILFLMSLLSSVSFGNLDSLSRVFHFTLLAFSDVKISGTKFDTCNRVLEEKK